MSLAVWARRNDPSEQAPKTARLFNLTVSGAGRALATFGAGGRAASGTLFAYFHASEFNRPLGTRRDLGQRQLDLRLQIGAAALPSTAATATERTLENVVKH